MEIKFIKKYDWVILILLMLTLTIISFLSVQDESLNPEFYMSATMSEECKDVFLGLTDSYQVNLDVIDGQFINCKINQSYGKEVLLEYELD